MKKAKFFFVPVIVLISLVIAFLTSFAADYSAIEFPKVIWGDPQHGEMAFSYSAPPCSDHYQMLDSLGINIFTTWFKQGWTMAFDTVNYNTPALLVLGSPPNGTLNGALTYTERALDCQAMSKRIVDVIKFQNAAAWYNSTWTDSLYYVEFSQEPPHHVYVDSSANDAGAGWPYVNLFVSFVWPSFTIDPDSHRPAYVRLKMRRDDFDYTPNTAEIAKVKIYESKKHDDTVLLYGAYNDSVYLDTNQITTNVDFDWIELHNIFATFDSLEMASKLPPSQGGTPEEVRYNIQVFCKRFCNVYVDSIAVYDSTGYNLGYYYENEPDNQVYTDRKDLINDEIDTFLSWTNTMGKGSPKLV